MKQSRKIFLIISVVLLAVSGVVAMTACDPDEPAPAPYTRTISSAEEFKAISEQAGEASALGTFTLTNDIDLGSDYIPLGNGVDTSFRGVLDGAGHTIRYSVAHTAAVAEGENELSAEETRYWGLFGYLYNAEVKNLTVEFDIVAEADSEVTYIGALAAFAYGDVKLENVTLKGNIELTPGNLAIYNATLDEGYKLTAFAGGAMGYAEGNLVLSGVTSSVDIEISGRFSLNDRSNIDDVYAGGIAGLIRTENNTSSSASKVTASDVAADGAMIINGKAVTAGGLFGLAQRAETSSAVFTGTLSANGLGKVMAGGIAGLYDCGSISDAAVGAVSAIESASGDGASVTISAGPLGSTDNTYLASLGGITGYIAFGSIENAVAYVYLETGDGGLNNYSGGIVGQLYNSDLLSVATAGEFENKKYTNFASGNDSEINLHGQYAAVGGIAGRVYGSSSYDKVYSAMSGVYQGIAGEIVEGIETVILENGETIEALFPDYVAADSPGAATADGTYLKIGDESEEDDKYTVTHRPKRGTIARYSYAAVEADGFKKDIYYDFYNQNGLNEGVDYPGDPYPEQDLIGSFNEILAIINN